jgi:hypothetical protein
MCFSALEEEVHKCTSNVAILANKHILRSTIGNKAFGNTMFALACGAESRSITMTMTTSNRMLNDPMPTKIFIPLCQLSGTEPFYALNYIQAPDRYDFDQQEPIGYETTEFMVAADTKQIYQLKEAHGRKCSHIDGLPLTVPNECEVFENLPDEQKIGLSKHLEAFGKHSVNHDRLVQDLDGSDLLKYINAFSLEYDDSVMDDCDIEDSDVESFIDDSDKESFIDYSDEDSDDSVVGDSDSEE